jgi:antirestriction protein ArdC
MTKEQRKERVAELRERLKSLSDDERKEIADRCGYHNINGHIFSPRNQCLIAFQSVGRELLGTFAGFRQWLSVGRVVRKGESGMMIFFPTSKKNGNGDLTDDDADNETRFYTVYVFDQSQTDELNTGESK